MDSGIAAILGAAVGALGTGGAAVVTGRWRARAVRDQLMAHELRLRRQRRVGQVRERREPRRKVYADFLTQARAVERALGRYRESHTTDLDAFHREVDTLDHLGVQVLLEGPPPVLSPSQELIRSAHRCIRPLRNSIGAQERGDAGSPECVDAAASVAEAGLAFTAEVRGFAELARRVLDDDPTVASPAYREGAAATQPG
ncbi:hypothetical protein San01_01140 [Streptomyces angustmyceticus]|uniref:Uncharacterized protein n=2 Tax=Streptomyces angustmyceticus TaxID=285578 RepID=A0A5J4LAG2_9ACTN|nr:hypothetical protein San01_01140 [Streptomyces angustmyceticus]